MTNYDIQHWVLWKPATRTKSSVFFSPHLNGYFRYSFGYDNSTGTYKVVAFGSKYDKERRVARSMVKVLSMRDNYICLEDNLSWNSNRVTVEQHVIVSLDLSTDCCLERSLFYP